MQNIIQADINSVLCILLSFSATGISSQSQQIRQAFAQPPVEYSSAPFWVWNDMLTETQVLQTLNDLAGQGIRQVIIHPRPGLMTPYLGEDWFRLWNLALRQAKRLGMRLWIYDENSYPSGFAGGWVPELMPQSRGKGLYINQVSRPSRSQTTIAVFAIKEGRCEDVSQAAKAQDLPEDGNYLVAQIRPAFNSPWYADHCYVDLLYPGVTERFIELTLEPYRSRFGPQFGKMILGSFTDEPHIRPAGGLPWTDDLPDIFQQHWGYRLIQNLPSLVNQIGDWRRIRHNYYWTLNQLFIDRWARPYYQWCQDNDISLTGHYWDHEWPLCTNVPDNMAMAAWQQVPGIDCLMNQYGQHTNAQFGNIRMVKELSSIANQLGRERRLCEIYGASGWDLTFADAKRIADWLAVLGVNLFNEHLSYVSIRGARKRDHPLSFSYHQPWWQAYHVHEHYLTRLSYVLSQGRQVNQILVLEPTTTAWMYQGSSAQLDAIGKSFFDLLVALEARQVEYDLADEYVMANWGSAQGGVLAIGQCKYKTLVIAPMTENIDRSTFKLINAFLDEGGKVFCLGQPPSRIDGALSQDCIQLARSSNWIQIDPQQIAEILAERASEEGFAISRGKADKGILLHHRRQLDDGQILFLVNTSLDQPSSGMIQCNAGGLEQWDLHTGKIMPYPFEKTGNGIVAQFTLPPCGSLLLFLSSAPLAPGKPPASRFATIGPAGPIQVRRLRPNVLTMDYVDIATAGQTKTGIYFYQANRLAFQANGLERNPWDSAVQFKDQILRRQFQPDSGFEATYRFTIIDQVPPDLQIVIERPELYSITCNGQPIRPNKGQWWLDRSFGRIPIAKAARLGENTVTIRCSPMTVYHELEPAYLIGDFSLQPSDAGFILAQPQPIGLGRWDHQGLPFYSDAVSYKAQFQCKPNGIYLVQIPSWHGSVAQVLVNGNHAGYITCPPWQCDVSRLIKKGQNTIELVVFGTLKNTLGPHHGNPQLGTAWPSMFQRAPQTGPPPGRDYHTVGYGLFEPFVLLYAQD